MKLFSLRQVDTHSYMYIGSHNFLKINNINNITVDL